jgi:hypothetical protein
LLARLHALPGAPEGQTQEVYQTLFTAQDHKKGEDIPVTFSFDLTRWLYLHY